MIIDFGGKKLKWHSAVCFVLSLDYYVSGNQLYIAQVAKNKGVAYNRKNPLASSLQADVAQQIADMGLEDSAPTNCFAYTCEAFFLFREEDWFTKKKKGLKRLDLTNLWKILEDGIFQGAKKYFLTGIGIDDSRCIELYIGKGFTRCKTPPFLVACQIEFFVPA
jgi:hypothetical protein